MVSQSLCQGIEPILEVRVKAEGIVTVQIRYLGIWMIHIVAVAK
jgi:hypothetical protein